MNAMPPDFSDPLADALRGLPGDVFAVLEGAHFADAPADLKARRLVSRPLYLEGDGDEDAASGPHLVAVPNLHALDLLRSHVGDIPALVFWSWASGMDALYRHLRTINLIERPKEDGTGYETVVFRHADPNVMASILSLLEPSQMSRLLGASAALAMDAPDFGGVRVVDRPANLPAMPRGYLRLDPGQMQRLRQIQKVRSRIRIGRYLREVAPEHTEGMPDTELAALVAASEGTGREIGLRSERAFGKWSYLHLVTNGQILHQDGVRRYMTDGAHSPDDKVTLMLRSMSLSMKQLARGGAR